MKLSVWFPKNLWNIMTPLNPFPWSPCSLAPSGIKLMMPLNISQAPSKRLFLPSSNPLQQGSTLPHRFTSSSYDLRWKSTMPFSKIPKTCCCCCCCWGSVPDILCHQVLDSCYSYLHLGSSIFILSLFSVPPAINVPLPPLENML